MAKLEDEQKQDAEKGTPRAADDCDDDDGEPSRQLSFRKLGGKVDMSSRKEGFVASMKADNAKRGVAGEAGGLLAGANEPELQQTLRRVGNNDLALRILDLSGSAQFSWLSQPQKGVALETIAKGKRVETMLLNSLALDNSHAEQLGAIVASHTSLCRLSLETNNLGEASLVALGGAMARHPNLAWVSVAHQRTGAHTQRGLLALLDALDVTPGLTKLQLGTVGDPSIRKRLEDGLMRNVDLRRQQRVAEGVSDGRAAAAKAHDWAKEAARLAASQPFEYGVTDAPEIVTPRSGSARLSQRRGSADGDPDDEGSGGTASGAEVDPTQRRYVLTNQTLWRVATEAERFLVFGALRTNCVLTSFEAVNAFVNDSLAVTLGEAIGRNATLTYVNVESNAIANKGMEALAAGLASNRSLIELKLANQRLSFGQAAETSFADAVEHHESLMHLTLDMRSSHARERVNRALTRRVDALREQRKASSGGVSQPPNTPRGVKIADWQKEAAALAASEPFEYGKEDGASLDQAVYAVRGNALWSRATETERLAVLSALRTNTSVRELELSNSMLNDTLAATLGAVLADNGTLTTLNVESNTLKVPGIDALAAGLAQNASLRTLKMANLHAPGSSSTAKLPADVEMRVAAAVDAHSQLLKFTMDLRHVPAKDVVQRALQRNNERERKARQGSQENLAE